VFVYFGESNPNSHQLSANALNPCILLVDVRICFPIFALLFSLFFATLLVLQNSLERLFALIGRNFFFPFSQTFFSQLKMGLDLVDFNVGGKLYTTTFDTIAHDKRSNLYVVSIFPTSY
jgi:hypothetical protein